MASNASYIGTVSRPTHYHGMAPTPCKSVSVFYDRTMSTRLNSTISSERGHNHWRTATCVLGLITIFLVVLLIGMLIQASTPCTPDYFAQVAAREEIKLIRDELAKVMRIAEECDAENQKLTNLFLSVQDQISMANFTIVE